MNEENSIIIPDFEKEDYYNTTTPFEWLYQFKDDKFKMAQLLAKIKEKASGVGVKNFVMLYKTYCQTMNAKNNYIHIENSTNFTEQELELNAGDWICEDYGITTTDKYGFEVIACNHPIIPVQRLVNIDTGVEKLKLAYRKGVKWRTTIADKKTLASSTNIVALADVGIAVNSENAKWLIKYLADIENLNYDKIPELNSVSRCGWLEGYDFSPYVDNVVFDGELNFKSAFESIKEQGDYKEWLDLAREVKEDSTIARIMLASSFASVLVDICECLPFFVHLWGGTEAGKTVALMLATSVWANPEMGKFIRTFNSTNVALELSASFVNSLPLVIDELMIKQDKKSFDDIIYQLTEGVGKGRGQKSGGLQRLNTWKNAILTTGEKPISSTNSNGGAVNRIVEIDCKDTKIFKDPHKVVSVVKKNFGTAGKIFADYLKQSEIRAQIKAYQKEKYKEITEQGVTEKQALAGSLILTADYFMDMFLFQDNNTLKISDITQYLLTVDDISQNKKALDFLYDFVAINGSKFIDASFKDNNWINYTATNDVWGQIEQDYIYIIKSKFDQVMSENGFSGEAFLSWANEKGFLKHPNSRRTMSKRIVNRIVRCVAIKTLEVNGDS